MAPYSHLSDEENSKALIDSAVRLGLDLSKPQRVFVCVDGFTACAIRELADYGVTVADRSVRSMGHNSSSGDRVEYVLVRDMMLNPDSLEEFARALHRAAKRVDARLRPWTVVPPKAVKQKLEEAQ